MIHFGLGLNEAWAMTMAEFMSLVKCKEKSEAQAKDVMTLTRKETEDVFNNLKFRGIVDEKGLVRNG